jgi:hypothetical protein
MLNPPNEHGVHQSVPDKASGFHNFRSGGAESRSRFYFRAQQIARRDRRDAQPGGHHPGLCAFAATRRPKEQ